ncbi:hypothetical protein B9G39_13895 [Zooshikella ganghwensis]|uniref:Uncharacterized protein n=1 Tax=Zooshikella ganghwensis TaxID=202772 RepID=A0A4P9VQV8_9GAMM|nr:hypothetical protein B9G39_13895 [Zooshikella ganghwensis]
MRQQFLLCVYSGQGLAILEFVSETGTRSTVSSKDQGWSSAAGGTNEFKHCMSTISDHHILFLYAIALFF